VDGHAVAARNEADDVVARKRVAALGKLDETPLQPFDDDDRRSLALAFGLAVTGFSSGSAR
jgi:hypothetical protein